VNYRLVFLGLLGILATIYIRFYPGDPYKISPLPQLTGFAAFVAAFALFLRKSSLGIVDLLPPISVGEVVIQMAIAYHMYYKQTGPPKWATSPAIMNLSTLLEMAPAIYLFLNA